MNAADLWPLKISTMDYICHAFLDSGDPTFCSYYRHTGGENEDGEGEGGSCNQDVTILLELVKSFNDEIELYLENKIAQTKLKMPNGIVHKMERLAE